MIPALIDKQDNFEVVRDKIATILANETASQQALATAGSKDPALWKLRVFIERSNPWEMFQGKPPIADTSPVINVRYENSTFAGGKGNVMSQQKADGIFNIDCIGYAISTDVSGGGHNPGDRAAALEAQRALRLVRNILMASPYVYLGLRGTVSERWPQTMAMFQPLEGEYAVPNVMGARFALRVGFNEFAPQGDESNLLELVSVDVLRAEDGEVVAEADYDYST